MERPAFAAAIGCASAIIAVLALAGLIDASILTVAALAVAVRGAGAAVSDAPLALHRTASAVLPFAALASVATWRSGAASLDAVRGANAILGAGVLTAPAVSAFAILLASASVVLATAAQTMAMQRPQAHPIGVLLDRAGILIAALLVATAVGGPDVDSGRSIIAWTAGVLLALLAMRVAEPIARHASTSIVAWGLAFLAILMGALR